MKRGPVETEDTMEKEDITSSGAGESEMTTETSIDFTNEIDYVPLDNSIQYFERKNYLHSTPGDTILFSSWFIKSSSQTVNICAILFILSFLERLLSFTSQRCFKYAQVDVLSHDDQVNYSEKIKQYIQHVTSIQQITMTILYGLQVLILCLLVLAVSSFNTWILTSIVSGSAFGTLLLPRSLCVSVRTPEKSLC